MRKTNEIVGEKEPLIPCLLACQLVQPQQK